MDEILIAILASSISGLAAAAAVSTSWLAVRDAIRRLASNRRTSNSSRTYSLPVAVSVASVTQDQIDEWQREHVIPASVVERKDGGELLFKDLLVLAVLGKLAVADISVNNLRVAAERIADKDLRTLESTTLFLDGQSIYEASTPDEALDLLGQGGGLFAISIGTAIQELVNKVATPAE